MSNDELKLLRAKLKSGEYDGVDIMHAWMVLDELLGADLPTAQPEPIPGAIPMADYAAASAAVPGRGEVLAKARKALSQPEPAAPVKTEADSFCDLHCADEHAPGCVLAADAEPVAWNPASKPLEFITECSDGTRFLNCAEMPAHAIRWSFAANPPRTALEPDPLEGTAHKEAVRRVGRADSVGGSMTDERKAFEAEISGPPYELDIDRWPNDQERYAWPGSYCDRGVDLAWCIWQARAALSAPAVPQWIPVSERLPEEGQEVLYYFDVVGPWVGRFVEGTHQGNAVFAGRAGFPLAMLRTGCHSQPPHNHRRRNDRIL